MKNQKTEKPVRFAWVDMGNGTFWDGRKIVRGAVAYGQVFSGTLDTPEEQR